MKGLAGEKACDIVTTPFWAKGMPLEYRGLSGPIGNLVENLRNIDLGLVAIQFAVLLFSLSVHEASHLGS